MQATPEKRIAKDGVAYTLEEFREYYGVRGTALFSECPSAEESQPEQPHAVAASSGYADSSVLQPAAEHKTLIESTEDMQRQLQNPGAEQPLSSHTQLLPVQDMQTAAFYNLLQSIPH